MWQVLGSAFVLLLLTVFAWRLRHQAPYLLVGWLWYVITLAPVSGVLQAGWQGRADRFLYVPSIGLFLFAVWGMASLAHVRQQRLLQGSAAMILAGCVALTVLQLRHWRDSLTLWQHTFAVTEDNFVARDSLAAALLDQGRTAEAVTHLERARELKPDHELCHYLLGIAAQQDHRLEDAASHLRVALVISPQYVEARAALAEVLAGQKRLDEAQKQARQALALAPDSALAMHSLGVVHLRQHDEDEALDCFREAVRLDPHAVPLRRHLIDELRRRGLHEEADHELAILRRLYPSIR
jgi:tetratricopeptide (TPR) repeat protein